MEILRTVVTIHYHSNLLFFQELSTEADFMNVQFEVSGNNLESYKT
jgi:hypothetical protein